VLEGGGERILRRWVWVLGLAAVVACSSVAGSRVVMAVRPSLWEYSVLIEPVEE
jgi:hypothetical protein